MAASKNTTRWSRQIKQQNPYSISKKSRNHFSSLLTNSIKNFGYFKNPHNEEFHVAVTSSKPNNHCDTLTYKFTGPVQFYGYLDTITATIMLDSILGEGIVKKMNGEDSVYAASVNLSSDTISYEFISR